MIPFSNANIKACFEAFPERERSILLKLRELIFECADEVFGVNELEETLKWGEPAYLSTTPKTGTTIRLGIAKNGSVAVFTHCRTTVMSDFQTLFPNDFIFEGSRAVYIEDAKTETTDKLQLLIKHALTYHIKKN